MINSAEVKWSGATLFAKKGHIRVQQDKVDSDAAQNCKYVLVLVRLLTSSAKHKGYSNTKIVTKQR